MHTRRVYVGNTEVLERARVRGSGLRNDQCYKSNEEEVGGGSHLVLHTLLCLCSLNSAMELLSLWCLCLSC